MRFAGAKGAGITVVPPTPVGADVFIDAVNGSDANDGLTQGTAWQTLDKCSGVTAGKTIALRKGQRHGYHPASHALLGGPLRLGANNITVDGGLWGTGANAIIYGYFSIKGVAGDWTNETAINANLWSTPFTSVVSSRYRLKVDEVIYTVYASHVLSTLSAVNSPGKWGLVGLPTSKFYIYSVGNPATVFSTIEMSSDIDWGVWSNARSGTNLKNLDVAGWRNGVDMSNDGGRSTDLRVYGCARRAFQAWGADNGNPAIHTRYSAFKNGFHAPGDSSGGEHGFIVTGPGATKATVTVDGFQIWENQEDGVQIGSAMSDDSLLILDGRNYRSYVALNRENPCDSKNGRIRIYHAQLHSSNEAPVTIQGWTTEALIDDCCLTSLTTSTSGGPGMKVQEKQCPSIVRRTGIYTVGSEPFSNNWNGKTQTLLANVFIGSAISTQGVVYWQHGKLDLLHNTIAYRSTGGTPGLHALSTNMMAGLTSMVRQSGPDGEGNDDYLVTCTGGTTVLRAWGEGAKYEFSGLTGASAGLNGVTLVVERVDSVSFLTAHIMVAHSLGAPATIDKTGGSLYSIPELGAFYGNAIVAGDKVLWVDKAKTLIDAAYGPAYLKDLNTTAERHVALNYGLVETLYTAAQTKAASGAGSLIAAEPKLGGAAYVTDYAATNGLRLLTATSIVVTNGVAVVTFPSAHGFHGTKICIEGAVNTGGTLGILSAVNNALVGWHFFRDTGANTIELDALPWVEDQTATGTITVKDGQLIAGSAGLASMVEVDLSLWGLMTDFHGNAFPAIGQPANFGAVAS